MCKCQLEEPVITWEASSERDTAEGRNRSEGHEARREDAEAQPHVDRDPVRGQAGRAAPQQRAHGRHETGADRSFTFYSNRSFIFYNECLIDGIGEADANLTSLSQMPNRHWSEFGSEGFQAPIHQSLKSSVDDPVHMQALHVRVYISLCLLCLSLLRTFRYKFEVYAR